MSSSRHPLEGEDPDDSEDWRIFEIRALGFQLYDNLPIPEASCLDRVQQIEDHPWTYASALGDRQEIVVEIEGSDSDRDSKLDETPSKPEGSNADGESQTHETLIKHEASNADGESKMHETPIKNEASNADGESKMHETLIKPEAPKADGESQLHETLIKHEASNSDGESKMHETPIKHEASNANGETKMHETPIKHEASNADGESQTHETPIKHEASNADGESKTHETLIKHEASNADGESKTHETLIKHEASNADGESKTHKTLIKHEASNADAVMHLNETLPNPKALKTEGNWQIEDHPRTHASAPMCNQQDGILIEDSDDEASKKQGVQHIKEHQWAHVPSPAGSQQDLVVIKVFSIGGESKVDKTFPKVGASNKDGELQIYETPPKPETYKISESQTLPKYEYKAPGGTEVSEAEGLHEDLKAIMREFNLDIYRTMQCLFFNSGEVGSTRHFLCTGMRPDGYPIWEPMDDEDLKKNDPNLRAWLVGKYGEGNVAKRLAFLES